MNTKSMRASGTGGGRDDLTIDVSVRGDGALAAEVARHGPAHQLRPPGLAGELLECAEGGFFECGRVVGVEQESCYPVLDRVGQPADPARDRQRTVPLRAH